ncbi:MAG: hypothetical protein JO110_10435, partial [Acetobacteraceae bacterium]|nr:hypothetical protein [Acetobacteraceae bacterium]
SDATGFFLAGQSLLRLHPLFQPGAELYYTIGDLGRPGRFADQQLLTGPVLAGGYGLRRFGLPGGLRYEAGYLFGATRASPHGAVRWRLDYELAF